MVVIGAVRAKGQNCIALENGADGRSCMGGGTGKGVG